MKFRRLLLAGATLAAIIGSYTKNSDDAEPFYVNKHGKSLGIVISPYAEFMPNSEFYGIAIGGVINNNGGSVYGLSLSVFGADTNSEMYGIQVAPMNYDQNSRINGLEISAMNLTECKHEVNGLQLALANNASDGKFLQLGVINTVYDDSITSYPNFLERGTRTSVIGNYKF